MKKKRKKKKLAEFENWPTVAEMEESMRAPTVSVEIGPEVVENIIAHPPNIYTFYQILANAHLRFRCVSMVYRCKVCEREPELKKEWASFLERQELSRHVPGTLAAQELCQKFVKYRQDLASLRTHLHQFSTQRRCLQQIEDDLPDKSREQWKVLVYEDFYSQYSEKPQNIGNKVNTLAFTLKWKGENRTRHFSWILFVVINPTVRTRIS